MLHRQTRGMLCRAGPFAWGRGSCLELVFARDPWRDAWLTAEEEDAQEQLGDILDRLNAWDASPSVKGSAAHLQPFQKGTNRWALPFKLRQAAFCGAGQTGKQIWHCFWLHRWYCSVFTQMQKLYGVHGRSCNGSASLPFECLARQALPERIRHAHPSLMCTATPCTALMHCSHSSFA